MTHVEQVLAATQRYNALGWIVIPIYGVRDGRCSCGSSKCESPAKHPRGTWADVKTVEESYARVKEAARTDPDLNIAVVTGLSGLCVVDIDIKPTVDGLSSFQKLLAEHGGADPLPAQFACAQTGSGGMHLFFRLDVGTKLRKDIAPGVELKAGASLIHLWPSRNLKGPYEWGTPPFRAPTDPEVLLPLPGWLAALGQGATTGDLIQDDLLVEASDLRATAKRLAKRHDHKSKTYAKTLDAMLSADPQKPESLKTLGRMLPQGSRARLLELTAALAHHYKQVKAERVLEPLRAALDLRQQHGASTGFDAVVIMLREAQRRLQNQTQGWQVGLLLQDSGGYATCEMNVLHCFLRAPDWQGVFGYDDRHARCVFLTQPPASTGIAPLDFSAGPVPIQDSDLSYFTTWFGSQLGMKVSSSVIREVILTVARVTRFDPVKERLLSLSWDGVPRLDTWLMTYANAEDTPLNRLFGAKWLLHAVDRALNPGCIFQGMLILEGEQGVRKTTLLQTLGLEPTWYSSNLPNLTHGGGVEARRALTGPFLFEMSELSTLKRAEAHEIKEFLSSRTDWLRPAYGRTYELRPRGCVFAGTTNDSVYLGDRTGNRRFWPVRVGQCDIEALERDREQLWAEAVSRFQAGEKAMLGEQGEALAAVAQEERRDDSLEDMLRECLSLCPRGKRDAVLGGIDDAKDWPLIETEGRFHDFVPGTKFRREVEKWSGRRMAKPDFDAAMRKIGWKLTMINGVRGYRDITAADLRGGEHVNE